MSDFGTVVVAPAPLAPWRSPLARAIHRNRSKPHSRYLQLATLSSQGRPANRTVVFRGFYGHSAGETNVLTFVTDTRSDKVIDLTHQPWGELCWYFTQTREQFRLAGAILLVTAQTVDADLLQARQRQWVQLSEASRQSFHWPSPGTPRNADAATFEVSPSPDPPPSFCLALFDPDGVDHLELRGDPQNRTQYQRLPNGAWQAAAVNP